jgi:hypothetical protein
LDDFRHSDKPFGSSRLFDVRGNPLDTPELLLQYLRKAYTRCRPNKYSVHIYINLSTNLIMATCTTSDSVFHAVVADLRLDASIQAQVLSPGHHASTPTTPSPASPATTVTCPWSHHSDASLQVPSTSPGQPLGKDNTNDQHHSAAPSTTAPPNLSFMGLLSSIVGTVLMVFFAIIWYFLCTIATRITTYARRHLESVHRNATDILQRYTTPATLLPDPTVPPMDQTVHSPSPRAVPAPSTPVPTTVRVPVLSAAASPDTDTLPSPTTVAAPAPATNETAARTSASDIAVQPASVSRTVQAALDSLQTSYHAAQHSSPQCVPQDKPTGSTTTTFRGRHANLGPTPSCPAL